MPTLKLVVDTGYVGAEHVDYIDVPDDEWERMTPAERDDLGIEAAQTLRDNHVDTYYEIAEDE